MRLRAISILLAVALGQGCYSIELSPCKVRCRLTFDCPGGFACLDDKFCHASVTEALCACSPLRCEETPGSCGSIDDTCGGTTVCPDCTAPLECGGAGTPNVCGDPQSCHALACAPNECGPSTDSCGDPRTCPGCPSGKSCKSGQCVPCSPTCHSGELACGDDGCGGSCGTCPDARWDCHAQGLCCIRSGEHCAPLTEGCNCCPGLFCISGTCTPAAGCAAAPDFTGVAEP